MNNTDTNTHSLGPFQTIVAIRKANAKSGHYFFQPEAMRFFGSKVYPQVYGGRYFLTSEQREPSEPCLWTVRMANNDGSIDTVGEFKGYASFEDARAAARRIVDDLLGGL